MKKLMLATLALVIALSVGLVAASAQTPADDVILAKAVWGTPQEIDGMLDDGWGSANVYENENFVGMEENETDIAAKWRVMYDNAYVYFFIEVADDSIGDADYEYCPANDYYNKNSVHLMFDLGYERNTAYDGNDFYIDISSYGYYNNHNFTATDYVTSATQLTDDGYTVEVRLDPAFYPDFAAEEGTCFGFDLWANDNLPPLAGRLFARTWADGSDSSWNNPSMMGTIQLEAKPADAIEVVKEEIAVKTYPNIEEELIPTIRPGTELREMGVIYTATTNAENPQGGGAKDIAVIADGVDGLHGGAQYDTYGAQLTDDMGVIWFGVEFDKPAEVSAVVFWEGGHWWDGGWFGASPFLQVLKDGKWSEVDFTLTPDYPEDDLDAQSPPYDSYIFTLNETATCEGVRVLGAPNVQASGHASCSEIEVYGPGETDPALVEAPRTYRNIEEDAIPTVRPGTELKELGVIYAAVTNAINPQGGGAKDIAVIADGSHEGTQYDTYGAELTDDQGIWFGVEFSQKAEASSVVFWEGGHWWDGGWFGSAPYVETLVGGEWVKANATLTPEYPEDNLDAQNPDFDAYIFTLDTPVVCEGIRVVGTPNTQAGGHASCSEIEVYGSLNVPAEPEPEIVIEEPETTAEPEPVPETPVDTKVDEELEAKAEAPQTFDFGVFAAIAACISLTGFAVSKKKK